MKAKLLFLSLLALLPALPAPAAQIFPLGSAWKYFVGTQEASSPTNAWREVVFNDSTWLSGPGAIGYPSAPPGVFEATIQTTLPTSAAANYLSVFCRRAFVINNAADFGQLTLTLRIDDGYAAWLNGTPIGSANVAANSYAFNSQVALGAATEDVEIGLTVPPGLLVTGTNVLAIQVFQYLTTSSDLVMDATLSAITDDPPVIESTFPVAGATVKSLTYVNVVFNENVSGVDAADLTINNNAATSIQVVSPREYQFNFPQPPTGTVNIAWAPAHGIADVDGAPQPFTGGGWSFTLDTNVPPPTISLSEFMTDNDNGIKDDDGTRQDWIEIYNPGPLDANLNGWFLTDTSTNLTKWRIPSLFVGANKYVIIWASMKDRANPAAPLHTNFKLDSAGGYLALVNPNTNIVSQFNSYPPQLPDVSYGRDHVEPTLLGYFTTPTPGAQNSTGGPGFMGEPGFSLDSAIYTSASLSLTLINTNGSGTIRYTTDRSVPTASSAAYSTPISLTANSTIKARVFPPGASSLLPSAVVARNFVFLDTTSTNFSSRLPMLIISTEGQGIAANVPPGGARTKGSLTVIDTFRGRSSLRGQSEFQALAAFEIFGQTSAGFAKQPIRIEIQDSIGNDLDKEILGMPADSDWRLRNPYNDKTLLNDFLGYEVWEKMGHYSVRRRLVEVFVDTGGGRVVYPGDYYGVMLLCESIKVGKDRVDIAKMSPYSTNEPAVSGGWIFKRDKDSAGDLNFSSPGGMGFGAIPLHLHEPKPNELRYSQGVTTVYPGANYTPAGTNQMNYLRSWLGAMERSMYTNTWLTQTGTNHYTNFVDVTRFADQMLHVEFTKQIDGYRLSDYFSKDRNGRLGPGPVWDWNLAYGNADYLAGGQTNGWYYEAAGELDHPWARRLITGTAASTSSTGDPNFTQLVADRWSMFRTNVLNATNTMNEVDELSTWLSEAAARDLYGKYRANLIGIYTWPNPSGAADGRDVDYVHPTNYLGAIETVAPAPVTGSIIGQMKKWILGRYLWMDSQFTRVPTFSLSDGMVGNGASVVVAPPAGSILYYTLNGTDPRASGGAVVAGALSNSGPVTITVTSNMLIVARAKAAASWKGTYSGARALSLYTTIPTLRITEIMYHPAAPPSGTNTEDFEYIELMNTGAAPMNLAGYSIRGGVDFTFPSMTLNAGQRVLVVANSTAFTARYGAGFNIAGQYTGNLENTGEQLVLQGRYGEPILDFSYNDKWYPVTDGFGFSLVIVDANAPLNTWGLPASWRAGGTLNGTPGQAEGAAPSFAQVVINEALTHSDPPPPTDTIELRNLSGFATNIGGWFLTDDPNTPRKFRIPNGTQIAAGGFLTFTESDFNNTNASSNVPFALSSMGDELFLFSGDANTNLTGYMHGFDYGAQFSGRTFGRYTTSSGEDHFVAQSAASLGTGNAGPLVGPLVISEIHYHPVDVTNPYGAFDNTEDEYIEFHNTGGAPVALYNPAVPANRWHLRDAVDFNFPATNLPAGGYALVVSFDPANAAALAAFRANNNVPVGVPVFGPFSGKLDNSEDSIELVRPDAPNPTNGVVPYVLADKVHYSHGAPWPAGADGIGPSLQRIVESSYGNDASNWVAGGQSPGASFVPGPLPVISAQPQNQTVLGTTTATFSLTAGPQPLSYQWRFRANGASSSTPIGGATSSILVLNNVSPAQAGNYDCVVINSVGAVISSNATLTVLIPAAISQHPGSVDVRVRPDFLSDVAPNTNAMFTVAATTSNPPLSYQWRMNGTNLLPSPRLIGLNSTTLLVSNVVMEDFGNYSCAITDGAGTIYSSNATLYPLVRPTILVASVTQTVPAFSPVPASVVLSNGFPPPFFYVWYKASNPFAVVTNDSKTNFMIIPGSIVANLSASYSVRLTNRALPTPNAANAAFFTLNVIPDADLDGMPDSYELIYSGTTNTFAPNLDADGDGMGNLAEFLAGTDPGDPNSYLRIEQAITPGTASVNFGALSNHTYTIQYSETLPAGSWSKLADIVALRTNRTELLIDPAWRSNKFYRVVTPRQP